MYSAKSELLKSYLTQGLRFPTDSIFVVPTTGVKGLHMDINTARIWLELKERKKIDFKGSDPK